MRVTKIEGTSKELAEFYASFRHDPKKLIEEKKTSKIANFKDFPLDDKLPTFDFNMDKVAALVDETVAKIKQKEFTPYEIYDFNSKIAQETMKYPTF